LLEENGVVAWKKKELLSFAREGKGRKRIAVNDGMDGEGLLNVSGKKGRIDC